MALPVVFNNRTVIEPGVYARLRGAVQRPINTASFGNLLWIDTGNYMSDFAYGSGVNGEISQNQIYQFSNVEDLKTAFAGGILWDLATYLFKPSSDVRVPGVNNIYYVRAATTTAATASYTFTGGGSNGGTVTFEAKVEGVPGNGAANGPGTPALLTRGFEVQMIEGDIPGQNFKLRFYRGSWRGQDNTVTPFEYVDDVAEADVTTKELIYETRSFNNVTQLYNSLYTDSAFLTWFTVAATPAGSGAVDAADLTANSARVLFAGGTQTFGTTDLDDVLELVKELDYTFVMFDRAGAVDASITSIWNHLENEALYEKFMVVGGGENKDDFNDSTDTATPSHSVQMAEYFDSQKVFVVHSNIKAPTISGNRVREYSSLYHAAMVCGRMAGLEPQIPVTHLEIAVSGVVHEMLQSERETAIQAGVLHLREVSQLGLVINQDINTKQQNEQYVYSDGTSPHGSIGRISSALNKSIAQNLQINFIAGQNINTASPEDIKAYVEAFLIDSTATATADNLILSFQNVVVNLVGSDYKIDYAFVPNGPINRIFVTGFVLPVNITA